MHKRERLTDIAENQASIMWHEFTKAKGLTGGESVMILSQLLQTEAKYLIRFERHGRCDIKGCLSPSEAKEELKIMKLNGRA